VVPGRRIDRLQQNKLANKLAIRQRSLKFHRGERMAEGKCSDPLFRWSLNPLRCIGYANQEADARMPSRPRA
jgi:hypothetical protein